MLRARKDRLLKTKVKTNSCCCLSIDCLVGPPRARSRKAVVFEGRLVVASVEKRKKEKGQTPKSETAAVFRIGFAYAAAHAIRSERS